MNPIYEFPSLIQLDWIKLDETQHFESRPRSPYVTRFLTSSAGGASSAQSPDVGDQRHLGVDGCGRHLDDGWRRGPGPGPFWRSTASVDGRKRRIYVME